MPVTCMAGITRDGKTIIKLMIDDMLDPISEKHCHKVIVLGLIYELNTKYTFEIIGLSLIPL